jgi:hypothetical protein
VRLWEDQLVTEPASVATAHTPSDRIMDHKPVLVSWNHADKLLQPVIKLRDFQNADAATTAPSSTRLIGLVIDRDSQPVVSTVGPILRPCMSNLSERPSKLLAAESLLLVVHFIGIRSSAMHEDSASLGAVATYGLVSDQSPSAFLESPSPARSFQRETCSYSIKTPSWRPPSMPKLSVDQ